MKQFDLSTSRIEDFIGSNFNELPYAIRALFQDELTAEELNILHRGRAKEELLDKAQLIIEDYNSELHPTWEQQVERQLERDKQLKISDLERSLERKQSELGKLDELAELDHVLPIGRRKMLREEIQSHTKELEVLNPPPTIERGVSEAVKEKAAELGLDVSDFMESLNNDQND